jgi:hypothetical protein
MTTEQRARWMCDFGFAVKYGGVGIVRWLRAHVAECRELVSRHPDQQSVLDNALRQCSAYAVTLDLDADYELE